MLVKILSDIHLSFFRNDFRYTDHGEHVCILAGDISEGLRGVNWAEANIPRHIQVLYVPGNHEYYGKEVHSLNDSYESYNREGTHVTVLLNDVVEYGGVRFAGSTLWTDFQLYNDPLSAFNWVQGLNDHQWIKCKNRQLQGTDVVEFHSEAMEFLSTVEADVLITHYAPQFSESPKWKNHPLTPGFLTKIPQNIHQKFKYHIHGHTHDCWDYELPYGTRVICNPKGYGFENSQFNEELVINIK